MRALKPGEYSTKRIGQLIKWLAIGLGSLAGVILIAPLGIRFLRKPAPGFERSALVSLHGSWKRSKAGSCKVVSLHWNTDGKIEEREFLTGFLDAKGVIGRPVDIAEASDAIYVSDDYAGVIYRVTH